MLKARSKITLIVIRISKNKDSEVFMQTVVRTSAINPDKKGKTRRKKVLWSEESSRVFLFLINREMDCGIRKYSILLGTESIITFLKYVPLS